MLVKSLTEYIRSHFPGTDCVGLKADESVVSECLQKSCKNEHNYPEKSIASVFLKDKLTV